MAFKQKSGSPFQRNFGVGKSPIKQNKTEEEIMAENASKLGENPMMMKSPAKNYMNMEKYSKPGDAVQFGEDEKDSPTDMGKHGKTATYMKSGFKMKEGSPFQRNFGIGDSPVKDRGTKHFAEDKDWMGKEKYQKHAKSHDDAYGPGHTEHGEQNPEPPTKMKSPVKLVESYKMLPRRRSGQTGTDAELIKAYTKALNRNKSTENIAKFQEMYPTPEAWALNAPNSGWSHKVDRVVKTTDTGDRIEEQIPFDQAMFELNKRIQSGVVTDDTIAEAILEGFTGPDREAAINQLKQSGRIGDEAIKSIKSKLREGKTRKTGWEDDSTIEEAFYSDDYLGADVTSKEEQKNMFTEKYLKRNKDASQEDIDKAFRKYLADIEAKASGEVISEEDMGPSDAATYQQVWKLYKKAGIGGLTSDQKELLFGKRGEKRTLK